MFKKSKQILLFIGGFFYSFVVITIASTLEYNKRFIYLLLMLIANLSVGLVYGYTFYCTGSAVAAGY